MESEIPIDLVAHDRKDERMILWNAAKLSEQLGANQVTERDYYKYLMVFLFLNYAAFASPGPESRAEQIFTFMVTIVALCFVAYFFQINEKIDGRDFVRRYISLSIPTFFRTLVFGIPLTVPMVVIADLGGFADGFVSVGNQVVFLGISIGLMRHYFVKIAPENER